MNNTTTTQQQQSTTTPAAALNTMFRFNPETPNTLLLMLFDDSSSSPLKDIEGTLLPWLIPLPGPIPESLGPLEPLSVESVAEGEGTEATPADSLCGEGLTGGNGFAFVSQALPTQQ